MHTIGEALLRFRKENGVTQAELAKQIGIKQPSVSDLELEISLPSVPTIQAVAKFFRWSVDEVGAFVMSAREPQVRRPSQIVRRGKKGAAVAA